MAIGQRYHPEWDTISRYIRELFDFYCARCGKDCRNSKNAESVLQVHHIDENPGNNDLENLIPLCAACHLKIEKEARLHAPYFSSVACKIDFQIIPAVFHYMVRVILLLFRFSNDRLHTVGSDFPDHCFLDSHLCDVLAKLTRHF